MICLHHILIYIHTQTCTMSGPQRPSWPSCVSISACTRILKLCICVNTIKSGFSANGAIRLLNKNCCQNSKMRYYLSVEFCVTLSDCKQKACCTTEIFQRRPDMELPYPNMPWAAGLACCTYLAQVGTKRRCDAPAILAVMFGSQFLGCNTMRSLQLSHSCVH